MSIKETIINWIQQMPDDLGARDILSALQLRLVEAKSSFGADQPDYEWPAPEPTEEEWRLFVAQGLREELEDPRQDIYEECEEDSRHGQG